METKMAVIRPFSEGSIGKLNGFFA